MDNQLPRETAILVGVITPSNTAWEVEDALAELALLADTAGADVVGQIVQRRSKLNVATFIGKGKVQELKDIVKAQNIDLVIFDEDLSAVQLRNLERTLGCKLLDRSALILDIFASRAKTAVAKTQVELAQLRYLMTRLTRQWTHLSRQKGGIGTKGPGETQIETDRRLIGKRISVLKERLQRIERQRETQRKGRRDHTRVSLVGYTNAGKSTLMNTLAETTVLAEDRLFATLDATTRLVPIDSNKSILLSDTVGFIRKLPHNLIESFKSTLDEVRESDVLLHVVDVHHPHHEDHIRVVNETLAELGCADKPTLMVFNKVDVLEEKGLLLALREQYPDVTFVSALRGMGLTDLKQALLRVIEQDYVEEVAYIPARAGKAVTHVHRVTEVVAEEFLMATDADTGNEEPVVQIRYRVAPKHRAELNRMLQAFQGFQPRVEPSPPATIRNGTTG